MSKRWILILVVMLLTLPPAIEMGYNSWKGVAHAGLRSRNQPHSNMKQAQPTVQQNTYSPAAGAASGVYPAPAPQAVPQTAAPSTAAMAIGTVVKSLPAGCTTVAAGGVSYSNCGGTFYRVAFQGSSLVYVVVEKP